MKKSLPYIAIIVAMMIWGTAGIMTKAALVAFSPLSLVTLRFIISVLLMLAVGLASRSLVGLDRKDIPIFLLSGFIQPFCYYMFETYGMRLIASPTIAEVLLCTGPLFAPLFAWILLREKVTVNNIIGIVLSTVGVVMMLLFGSENFSLGSVWSVPLLMLAVFSAVFYTILLNKIPARYNSLSIVFYVQLSALIFFIPVWAVIDAPHLDQLAAQFSLHAFGAVVYLAVFCSVIAFVLFCYVVRHIGVTRANAFNNIRPVFTALFMLLFYGEQMPWQKWIAMLIVIAGLFICQKTKKNESGE